MMLPSDNLRETKLDNVLPSYYNSEFETSGLNTLLLKLKQECKNIYCSKSLDSRSTTSNTTHDVNKNEDLEFLKTSLGKPLSLAISEIMAKQPRNPIHYLGCWLFRYRLNEELDSSKKLEIQVLIEKQKQFEKEHLHAMYEEEARALLVKLAIKSEKEVLEKELYLKEVIGSETESENSL